MSAFNSIFMIPVKYKVLIFNLDFADEKYKKKTNGNKQRTHRENEEEKLLYASLIDMR